MTARPEAHDPAGAGEAAKDQTLASQPQGPSMVFLVGPPGSGKSTLGRRACTDVGLRFVDLVDDGNTGATLEELVGAKGADVVALPWAPKRDAPWLGLCRRSGETVALWAHPLDMQARSGRAEPLFTPVRRLSTRGGFGRNGTGCREFRHLARACEHVLLLVGLSEEVAAQDLMALIEESRTQEVVAPAEREGLLRWAGHWTHDFDADATACEILVDAMARFTLHLKARGTSPRTMSGVYGDLNAAGSLVMCYDAPKGKAVLDSFGTGPSSYEFRKRISDSPRALARFRSTWEAFATFLRDLGMAGGGESR